MRTYTQAKAFALAEAQRTRGGQNWFNLCQKFSRQCVGAPPFGRSARQAFNAIPAQNRHSSSPPPPGSIAYYGRSDKGFGHAVFVVEGGFVYSNDILRRGRIDRVRWDIFVKRWNMPYRGWIDACPSGRLPVQAKAAGTGIQRITYRRGKKVYRSKMRLGQRDSDSVWNLQVALIAKGYKLPHGPTGDYDQRTRSACAAYQRRQGWAGRSADGIAGPKTVRRLGLLWVDA
jgi:hypothetical protein